MSANGLYEFFTLNNTRVGAYRGTVLTSGDGTDHYVTGKIAQCWDFTGVGDARRLYGAFAFPVSGVPWSVSFWVKRRTSTYVGSENLVELRTADAQVPLLIVDKQTATLRTIAVFVNGSSFYSPNAGKNTTWHHVLLTHDGAMTYQMYLDGIKKPSSQIHTPAGIVTELQIGRAAYIDGLADAFGFWTRQLSDDEAAELWNANTGWEYTGSPLDETPDAFGFADQTGAARNVQVQSDVETITGMDAGTVISVTGGEYSIDGGAYTAAAGTINPGQTLRLRLTTSADYDTDVSATVTVGTYATTWTVRTGLASFVTLLLARAA